MNAKQFHVLFICTGNSARSIMGEVLVNHWGGANFRGFSAGSTPLGQVHPMTLALLRSVNLPTNGLRSKSWEEFGDPNTPAMDFVFTVCDQAAGEVCPVWPGNPITAHWGIHDPATAEGTEEERRKAFLKAFLELQNRIKIFVSLPFEDLDRMNLKRKVQEIGETELANEAQEESEP